MNLLLLGPLDRMHEALEGSKLVWEICLNGSESKN